MLQELAIKNFAIIDDLRINFSGGLTILSGETGAGKSIIINAVNLLLGSRANAQVIRTGEDSAEIEASFAIKKKSATAAILEEHGYEPSDKTDGELVVKRIISGNNRHKVYINGSLATMQVLTRITGQLASISGQHAHQHLLQEETHLDTLDQLAGLMPLRNTVSDGFHSLLPQLKERDRLTALQAKRQDQIDLLEFQKKEIESAAITPGEDGELEKEKKRLKNATELYTLVHGALDMLYDDQGSIIEQLTTIRKNLDDACRLDEDLDERRQAAIDIEARAEDIVSDLRHYLDTVQLDEGRLEIVEERLDQLIRLKKKYGPTLDDVIARLGTIDEELNGLENLTGQIEKLDAQISADYEKLAKTALELSAKRRKSAKAFINDLEKELAQLKMEGTCFDINFSTLPADARTNQFLTVEGNQLTETGLDRIAFQIAPNPGEAMKPLANIASGGELSRVVLALKALTATKESVETVVFDEVDAGIGGETAEVVGKKLHHLAGFHQLICITHLAQIAAFGDHHFKIVKTVESGRTVTRITPLSKKDRAQEIARMAGGEEITAKTLAHAEELLKKAGKVKI